MSSQGHQHSGSSVQNYKAHLANAYNELGKELASQKIRVVGNYTLGRVIGEGAFGKVRMGTHRLTSTKVAIKQLPKLMDATLTREIHHHRELHHPHVVQLYEIIATESSIWLVTELCSGGELFDYLVEKGRLTEEETRIIFGQLCLAVAYVHNKGVVHRDLKLENVLLDERCRVKLSDFGFTREFERGGFLNSVCGTMSYSAPEMIQAQKYLGPEVDIWSLGVILYTLLVGAQPFDDEDEIALRAMIIKGEFEDQEWLSDEARDLIKGILQKDPAKRLTISQILAHPWFKRPGAAPAQPAASSSVTSLPMSIPRSSSDAPPPSIDSAAASDAIPSAPSSESSSDLTSDSLPSAPSEPEPHTPTTPDDPPFAIPHTPRTPENRPFAMPLDDVTPVIHRNASQKTIKKPLPVPEELSSPQATLATYSWSAGSAASAAPPDTPPPVGSSRSHQPPPLPMRTPARTKRRSVSSALSETPSLPDTPLVPVCAQDYANLADQPAPLLFATAHERELLNALSMLGFDTAQLVHSVLSNACDAAGAVWWMLKRKSELRAVEEGKTASIMLPSDSMDSARIPKASSSAAAGGSGSTRRRGAGTRSPDAGSPELSRDKALPPRPIVPVQSAPQLSLVPPTPTVAQTTKAGTPPRTSSPTAPFLSPAPSTSAITLSHPTTPGNPKDGTGSRGRKDSKRNRSGSVSIMQRATTALEAAGLVRKKSAEVIKEREKEKEKEKEKERERDDHPDSRSSHGSSSRLTKSPPLRAIKDALMGSTTSLDMDAPKVSAVANDMGSPWVIPGSSKRPNSPPRSARSPEPSSTHSPGDTLTSLPGPNADGTQKGRNRASLLSAFRMWFNEDRKGKRKSDALVQPAPYSRSHSTPLMSTGGGSRKGTMKRRTSTTNASGSTPRPAARPRMNSSRRSSSVHSNSRRSSVASVQKVVVESPSPSPYEHSMPGITRQRSDASRRSLGSRTPNSERGEFPSRPSSVRSFHHHRKSPSAGSGQSAYRNSSPLPKYHKRHGSGSSSRARQMTSPTKAKVNRPLHGRSNSAASIHSLQSLGSSRPASLYDLSESESRRTESPMRRMSRRSSLEETPRRHPLGKRHAVTTHGRSSWKKSWGMEPPGWGSRPTHLPIEVIAVSPLSGDGPINVRDVFTGRQSLNLGDEEEWVDEDDDGPAFAGGLGQLSTSASANSTPSGLPTLSKPEMFVFTAMKAPPRGPPAAGKRTKNAGPAKSSPVNTEPPEQVEMRATRRQPVGRAGASYRPPAIQEDEEEEEE